MVAAVVSQQTGAVAATSNTTITVSPALVGGTFARVLLGRSGGMGTGQITSVVDSTGTFWTLATRGAVTGQVNTRLEYWYRNNCPPITSLAVSSATSQTYAWEIVEWSGIDTTTPIDIASPDNSGTASSTTLTTPAITTTNANDVIEACWQFPQRTTSGLTAGYTALNSFDFSTTQSGRAAYQLVSATGTYNASLTASTSAACGSITLALRAAAVADVAFEGWGVPL